MVTNTLNCKDLTTGKKITNLKTLISTKIELYTSWLLVVDNVTSISRVHVHLPESGNEQWANGQLLITTQDTPSIPLPSSFIKHISVSKGMKPHDASCLLAELSCMDDSEMEKEVAQALDNQPLALASAATYVRQVRQNKATSHFGWSDYLEKLSKGQRGSTETILAETNPSYQESMTTATTLAVEKAMTCDKIIHHTFSLLSVCAPHPVSQDIVINYILNVDEEIKDKEMIAMKIQRCSLILDGEDEGGAYIRVHQVFYDVINSLTSDFPEIQQLQTVDATVRSFIQFVESNLSVNWDDKESIVYSKPVIPHLKTLFINTENLFYKRYTSQETQRSIINVQHYPSSFQKLGQICQMHCYFDVAMKYFNQALEFVQRSEEYIDEEEAQCHLSLGSVHHDLGDLEQAKEYYERALAICLKKLGPDHLDVAMCYNTLGSVHHLGDLKQAKEYHERALTIYLKNLGPDHLDVAMCSNNLGSVHHHLGDLEQAKEYHERALTIYLKMLDPDHPDVATCYNDLGTVHCDLGDLEQAKEYHERALTICLRKLGPEDLDAARCYNNLGTIHRDLGDLDQAKKYCERALTIYLKKLGPDHLNVAMCYNNLGTVHRDLDDLEQAKKYHERAVTIGVKKLGPDHLNVAMYYNNLGTVHHDLGDLEHAKKYHERAVTIGVKKLGPDHLKMATYYNNVGTVHIDLGLLEKAKEYLERALIIHLKKLGPDHPDVATCYNNLGTVHQDLGDLEQAKEYHQRALTIRLKKLGPDHLDVLAVQQTLTQLQQMMDLISGKKHVRCCTIL